MTICVPRGEVTIMAHTFLAATLSVRATRAYQVATGPLHGVMRSDRRGWPARHSMHALPHAMPKAPRSSPAHDAPHAMWRGWHTVLRARHAVHALPHSAVRPTPRWAPHEAGPESPCSTPSQAAHRVNLLVSHSVVWVLSGASMALVLVEELELSGVHGIEIGEGKKN